MRFSARCLRWRSGDLLGFARLAAWIFWVLAGVSHGWAFAGEPAHGSSLVFQSDYERFIGHTIYAYEGSTLLGSIEFQDCFIDIFSVEEIARNRGVGTELMNRALQKMQPDCDTVSLDAVPLDAGRVSISYLIKVYAKFGFLPPPVLQNQMATGMIDWTRHRSMTLTRDLKANPVSEVTSRALKVYSFNSSDPLERVLALKTLNQRRGSHFHWTPELAQSTFEWIKKAVSDSDLEVSREGLRQFLLLAENNNLSLINEAEQKKWFVESVLKSQEPAARKTSLFEVIFHEFKKGEGEFKPLHFLPIEFINDSNVEVKQLALRSLRILPLPDRMARVRELTPLLKPAFLGALIPAVFKKDNFESAYQEDTNRYIRAALQTSDPLLQREIVTQLERPEMPTYTGSDYPQLYRALLEGPDFNLVNRAARLIPWIDLKSSDPLVLHLLQGNEETQVRTLFGICSPPSPKQPNAEFWMQKCLDHPNVQVQQALWKIIKNANKAIESCFKKINLDLIYSDDLLAIDDGHFDDAHVVKLWTLALNDENPRFRTRAQQEYKRCNPDIVSQCIEQSQALNQTVQSALETKQNPICKSLEK